MYFNSQHKLMYHALSTGRDDFKKMTREILTISENLNKGTDLITNGNRTECGPIRSEIIPVITKSMQYGTFFVLFLCDPLMCNLQSGFSKLQMLITYYITINFLQA